MEVLPGGREGTAEGRRRGREVGAGARLNQAPGGSSARCPWSSGVGPTPRGRGLTSPDPRPSPWPSGGARTPQALPAISGCGSSGPRVCHPPLTTGGSSTVAEGPGRATAGAEEARRGASHAGHSGGRERAGAGPGVGRPVPSKPQAEVSDTRAVSLLQPAGAFPAAPRDGPASRSPRHSLNKRKEIFAIQNYSSSSLFVSRSFLQNIESQIVIR